MNYSVLFFISGFVTGVICGLLLIRFIEVLLISREKKRKHFEERDKMNDNQKKIIEEFWKEYFYMTTNTPDKSDFYSLWEKLFDSQWISVRDTLPPVDEKVLIWNRELEEYYNDGEKHIYFGYLRKNGKFTMEGSPSNWKITHWMPLPNKPFTLL